MAKISINTSEITGKIKPMHAVGQPPLCGQARELDKHFHYLTEAGIPYSRLHDVGGPYGGNKYVDIPNIFRDFDADENDPKNYDFAFTDALVTALQKANVEPYYRLGVTIENGAEIKSYRIDPPKDFYKWARICEHIIAHYIDGWADGFNYNITYWEIWNEPDDGMRVSQMWNGTKEQYYELYEVTAKHLKAVFGNRIKVGGYAALDLQKMVQPEKYKDDVFKTYFEEFFYGFVDHVKKTESPLDFFSWHSYYSAVKTIPLCHMIREYLDKNGFVNTESHINEWNPVWRTQRATAHQGAEITAMLLGMQNAPLDVLMIYDAKISGGMYMALFDPYYYKPCHGYYALASFNFLYELGNQVEATCDTEGVFAVAASDGKKNALLISNVSGEDTPLDIEGVDLTNAKYHVIDRQRLLSWAPPVKSLENHMVVLIEY